MQEALVLIIIDCLKFTVLGFVNHRSRGFKTLLETWPAYTVAYENAVANTQESSVNVRAKISGLLKKFKSYSFMCTVHVYLDLLEKIGPSSLVFEAESLMPYEIPLAVSRTVMELREKEQDIGIEYDSYVHRYNASESGVITGEFAKAGDKRKKSDNRECIKVEFQMDVFDRDLCLKKMQDIEKKGHFLGYHYFEDTFRQL